MYCSKFGNSLSDVSWSISWLSAGRNISRIMTSCSSFEASSFTYSNCCNENLSNQLIDQLSANFDFLIFDFFRSKTISHSYFWDSFKLISYSAWSKLSFDMHMTYQVSVFLPADNQLIDQLTSEKKILNLEQYIFSADYNAKIRLELSINVLEKKIKTDSRL